MPLIPFIARPLALMIYHPLGTIVPTPSLNPRTARRRARRQPSTGPQSKPTLHPRVPPAVCRPQKGLCIISPGVKVPARVTLCPPGHRIVTTEIILDLPASLESFLDIVYEAAPVPLDACWNKLIPAKPQLGDGAATLLVVPHWFKQAGLSAALFDVRAMTGKVFAEVLPRQTSLEAIQRVAGPTVIEPFEVFLAGSLRPLQRGQIVHVEEGDTLCFAPLRGPYNSPRLGSAWTLFPPLLKHFVCSYCMSPVSSCSAISCNATGKMLYV